MAQRIELITPGQIANADAGASPVVVSVPAVVTGTTEKVGWRQKLKGSYKAIVALIGALAVLLTQIHTLTPFLPDKYRSWIGGAAVALTALGTWLAKNEHWVEGL